MSSWLWLLCLWQVHHETIELVRCFEAAKLQLPLLALQLFQELVLLLIDLIQILFFLVHVRERRVVSWEYLGCQWQVIVYVSDAVPSLQLLEIGALEVEVASSSYGWCTEAALSTILQFLPQGCLLYISQGSVVLYCLSFIHMSKVEFPQLGCGRHHFSMHIFNLILHIEQIYDILCSWLHIRFPSWRVVALIINLGCSHRSHEAHSAALDLIDFMWLLLQRFLPRSHRRLTFAQSLELRRAIFRNLKRIGELLHLQTRVQLLGIVIINIMDRQFLVDPKLIRLLLWYIQDISLHGVIALCESWPFLSFGYHMVNHLRHVVYISLDAFKPRLFHLFIVFIFIGLLHCIEFLLLFQCLLSVFSQVCGKFAWSCISRWLGLWERLLLRLLVFFGRVDAAHVHRDAVACELNPWRLVELALLEGLGLRHGEIDAASLCVQSLEAILFCSKRRLALLGRTSWLTESIQVALLSIGVGQYMVCMCVACSRELLELVLLILSQSYIHFLLVTCRLCFGSFQPDSMTLLLIDPKTIQYDHWFWLFMTRWRLLGRFGLCSSRIFSHERSRVLHWLCLWRSTSWKIRIKGIQHLALWQRRIVNSLLVSRIFEIRIFSPEILRQRLLPLTSYIFQNSLNRRLPIPWSSWLPHLAWFWAIDTPTILLSLFQTIQHNRVNLYVLHTLSISNSSHVGKFIVKLNNLLIQNLIQCFLLNLLPKLIILHLLLSFFVQHLLAILHLRIPERDSSFMRRVLVLFECPLSSIQAILQEILLLRSILLIMCLHVLIKNIFKFKMWVKLWIIIY